MTAYPDTSFLIALYRAEVNSSKAAAHFAAMPGALPVTSLLLFEFRQALRFQEFLHRGNPRLGFNRATGLRVASDLQTDLAAGAVSLVPSSWNDVIQIAEQLSSQYTDRTGHRGFDILHVATALHLGAREFLTFDADQKKLAKAEGLKTPL